jgi:phage gpG-like protein
MLGSGGQVFGFEDARRFIGGLGERLGRAVQEWVIDGALLIESRTKQNIANGRQDWDPITDRSRRSRRSEESRKRFAPLLDTGMMMQSVGSEVEKRGADTVAYIGWGVDYGVVHELGTARAGLGRNVIIPARPHMGPAFDESEKELRRELEERVRGAAKP